MTEHVTDGSECPCGTTDQPVFADDGSCRWLVVHRAPVEAALTPAQALALIAEQHEPYLPRLISVMQMDPCHPDYNAGEWHDPSLAERAESAELWCDGCRTPAARCRVADILALTEGVVS